MPDARERQIREEASRRRAKLSQKKRLLHEQELRSRAERLEDRKQRKLRYINYMQSHLAATRQQPKSSRPEPDSHVSSARAPASTVASLPEEAPVAPAARTPAFAAWPSAEPLAHVERGQGKHNTKQLGHGGRREHKHLSSVRDTKEVVSDEATTVIIPKGLGYQGTKAESWVAAANALGREGASPYELRAGQHCRNMEEDVQACSDEVSEDSVMLTAEREDDEDAGARAEAEAASPALEVEDEDEAAWEATLNQEPSTLFDSLDLSLSRGQEASLCHQDAPKGAKVMVSSGGENGGSMHAVGAPASTAGKPGSFVGFQRKPLQRAVTPASEAPTVCSQSFYTSRSARSTRVVPVGTVARSCVSLPVTAPHYEKAGYAAQMERKRSCQRGQRQRVRYRMAAAGKMETGAMMGMRPMTPLQERAQWGKGKETAEQRRQRELREKKARYAQEVQAKAKEKLKQQKLRIGSPTGSSSRRAAESLVPSRASWIPLPSEAATRTAAAPEQAGLTGMSMQEDELEASLAKLNAQIAARVGVAGRLQAKDIPMPRRSKAGGSKIGGNRNRGRQSRPP